MAFDLKLHGDELDRVGSSSKDVLFKNMLQLYTLLGRRFKCIVIDLSADSIVCSECSPWRLTSQGIQERTGEYHISIKLMYWATSSSSSDIEIDMGPELLFDDVGPFVLKRPWSVKGGYLESESSTETYSLMTQVPGLSRRLGRRPSDVVGATNAARKTYSQTINDTKKARVQAKPKPSGVRSLGSLPTEPSFAAAQQAVVGGNVAAAVAKSRPIAEEPPQQTEANAAVVPLQADVSESSIGAAISTEAERAATATVKAPSASSAALAAAELDGHAEGKDSEEKNGDEEESEPSPPEASED